MMTAVDSVWKIWRQLTDLLWVVYRFFAVALPPSTGVLLWLPQRRVHRRGKGFCLTRQIVSLESLFDESVQLLLAVVRNHDNHRALFNPIDYSTHPNAYLSVRLCPLSASSLAALNTVESFLKTWTFLAQKQLFCLTTASRISTAPSDSQQWMEHKAFEAPSYVTLIIVFRILSVQGQKFITSISVRYYVTKSKFSDKNLTALVRQIGACAHICVASIPLLQRQWIPLMIHSSLVV